MPSSLDTQVLALFDHAPKRDRLHVRGRFRTCPVAIIDAEVPRGRVLEVGCGHGLVSAYLALSARDRQVTGIDIDARKIAVASHAQSHVDEETAHLEFHQLPAGDLPDGPWDGIVIVDVLYLLDKPAEFALLDACVERLSPGGVLVIKETDVVPRWKHWVAGAEEVVATKVLRITEGSSLSFTPVAEIADHLRSLGLEVTTRRVDKGYMYPQRVVAQGPSGASERGSRRRAAPESGEASARAAPESGEASARAAPESGEARARGAPESGEASARAAPQSGEL